MTATTTATMTRRLATLTVTVKDAERAFLTRNGRLERVLEPVRNRYFDPLRKLAVEMHNVLRAELPADRYAVVKAALPEAAATAVRGGRDPRRRGCDRQP